MILTLFLKYLPKMKHKGFVFEAPMPLKAELRDVEKTFARLFSSKDGKIALAHLQTITFLRVAAMDAPEQNLRYLEGQRALMSQILRLIERGRQPS